MKPVRMKWRFEASAENFAKSLELEVKTKNYIPFQVKSNPKVKKLCKKLDLCLTRYKVAYKELLR